MTKHTCKYCNYETEFKNHYDRHINTQKHKNAYMIKNKKEEEDGKFNIIIKQNKELRDEIEKLKHAHKKMEQSNNENTHKIVKEARVIKHSILSVLNSDFKNTPSIDYIKEDEFRTELEEEFKFKIDNPDNKLFMRIFSDYQKRKLIGSLCNVILRIIKNEDQKKQSVFNIDASRGNYATKIQDIWHNDKKGLQLKKYTVDVVTKFMLKIMDVYKERLIDMYNENKKKRDVKVSDYIMEYQGLLFDVNSFLSSPTTHKKIIIQLCPELRFDENLLIEN